MRIRLKAFAALCLTAAALILVAGCAPSNSAPTIVSLVSHDDVLAPLDSCLIECIAEDKEGDALEYAWSTDGGTVTGYEGTVAWTAPTKEGIYHITCQVTDGVERQEGGAPARETVTVVVKDNHYPTIDGMGADRDWVRPGEECAVRCQASDIDGDVLTYTWSADAGTISGEGGDVTWTAPDVEGDFTIRVVVTDGYGGEYSAHTVVKTAVNQPLVVKDLVVTALDEPAYLNFYDERIKVLKGKSYLIRCDVNEPLRIVSYEWSDGGPVCVFPVGSERFVFELAPNVIRWTAPLERGDFTITVVARDAEGHYAEKSMVVNVETCTCAFSDSTTETEAPGHTG